MIRGLRDVTCMTKKNGLFLICMCCYIPYCVHLKIIDPHEAVYMTVAAPWSGVHVSSLVSVYRGSFDGLKQFPGDKFF